eukprot:2791743-Rhodomonas_salina.3
MERELAYSGIKACQNQYRSAKSVPRGYAAMRHGATRTRVMLGHYSQVTTMLLLFLYDATHSGLGSYLAVRRE